jgi:hypothetical protein
MKHYIFLICFFLAVHFFCSAHEEPAKTLAEKKDKETAKQKIVKSNINSVTVWKSIAENGIEKNQKQKAFRMGYNKTGSMVYIEAYKNDSLQERDEITYSESGDMISQTDYSTNHNVMEKDLFFFDAQGRLFSGITKNSGDSVSESFKIIQSKDKKCIEYIKYTKHDSIEYKLIYNYADNFDKCDFSEALKYDGKSGLMMKVTKDYNSEGQQIKKSVFDGDNKLMYYFQYEYDLSGNMTKVIKTLADGTVEWYDIYSYESNGNCNDLKSYNNDNILQSHLIYEFVYNK